MPNAFRQVRAAGFPSCGRNSAVEFLLPKQVVARSNRVVRSPALVFTVPGLGASQDGHPRTPEYRREHWQTVIMRSWRN